MADAFDALGYSFVQIKGSGARGVKMRRRKCSIAGDALAIPYSRDGGLFLQVEIGAHTPGAVFRELRKALLPGFTPFFVQYYRKRRNGKPAKKAERRYFVDEDSHFKTLDSALAVIACRLALGDTLGENGL